MIGDRLSFGVLIFWIGILGGVSAPGAVLAEQDEVGEVGEAGEAGEVGEVDRILIVEDERWDQTEEIEADGGRGPVSASPSVSVPKVSAGPVSPIEEVEADIQFGRREPVIYRGTMNDQQVAAVRAGDYTLDPTYRGFIPIPNTATLFKFNARPRLDVLGSTGDTGTDFRFVPAKFPASDEKRWGFNANANGSQMRLEVVAPSVEGNFRFFYQNDFFGSNDDPMKYRLQHLYGSFYNVTVGYTFGVFEDPDAWPDTVDYEGPNSVIYARRALGHFKMQLSDNWELTLGLEDSSLYVDTDTDPGGGADSDSRAPDAGVALRWASEDWGHVRASAIVRSISTEGDAYSDEDVIGWGLNTSASLNVTENDTMQWWFVYGEGVGGMGSDASFLNADAAYNNAGNLRALEYWSTMVALTHHWSPKWRSTLTHGYVSLETTNAQPGDSYQESHYGTANVIYQIFKRMSLGLEAQYGHKETKDGRDNDLFQVQLGLSFAIFD